MLLRPDGARALLVFGHGAGAGMRHEFMEDMAQRLAAVGVATWRYEFPYMAAGKRRVDPEPLLLASVESAIVEARKAAGDLPLFAGGKSMGGRMTSRLMAARPQGDVRGLVFFGFPLHPAGKPSRARAEHLGGVALPMLFLQGTRDNLAEMDLIRATTSELDGALLHEVDGADHGFDVLKRSGRSVEEVRLELAEATRAFCARHGGL